jgi:hypothetical protein
MGPALLQIPNFKFQTKSNDQDEILIPEIEICLGLII